MDLDDDNDHDGDDKKNRGYHIKEQRKDGEEHYKTGHIYSLEKIRVTIIIAFKFLLPIPYRQIRLTKSIHDVVRILKKEQSYTNKLNVML